MAPSLRDLFTPLVSYVLLFCRSPQAQQRTFTDLNGDIERLLADELQLVRRHDVPKADYETARFAVVAWIDEMILRYTQDANRELAQQWKRSPLQVRLYNTANAGEEFYDRLAALSPAQKEIREIYYLCLCLGFRGRYYDESQEFKLVQLRRELSQHLPDQVPELLELERRGEKVTPQPYAVKAPPRRRPERSLAMLWAVLASAVLAAGVLFAVSRLPQGRTPEEILADLNTRVRGLPCCEIAVAYQDQTGTVTLSGHVDSEARRQEVTQAVRAVPETVEVRDTLTLMPRPFCDVVALLHPLQGGGGAVKVRLQKGCDTVYRAGESLVFTIDANKPLEHVYLDYYVADRETVGHLYPGGADGDSSVAGATLSVGGPSSTAQWEVEPPFGMELITAISSPKPLFASHPPGVEKAATYIDALRAALPKEGTSTEVSADYCFITTASQ
jgi:type VI secretion system protein ImpK